MTYAVKDEPMTGVWADTPNGEMYFESTNDAIHSLRIMFPGVEFEFDRQHGNRSLFPIRDQSEWTGGVLVTYEVGDIIEYIALGGLPRRVRVTNRESNIKNGRPGFDGEIVDGPDEGMTVWGYDEQVTKEEA